MKTTWIIFILCVVASTSTEAAAAASAKKLTTEVGNNEKFSLPQREKEQHFPDLPELPLQRQMFVLVSEANDTHEQGLIAGDIPGLPLGVEEADFGPVVSENEENSLPDDDAVVLEADGEQSTKTKFSQNHFKQIKQPTV
jgi:hypothetical protein